MCLPLLIFPCTIKSRSSPGTGSPGWSRKKGRKTVVVVVVVVSGQEAGRTVDGQYWDSGRSLFLIHLILTWLEGRLHCVFRLVNVQSRLHHCWYVSIRQVLQWCSDSVSGRCVTLQFRRRCWKACSPPTACRALTCICLVKLMVYRRRHLDSTRYTRCFDGHFLGKVCCFLIFFLRLVASSSVLQSTWFLTISQLAAGILWFWFVSVEVVNFIS